MGILKTFLLGIILSTVLQVVYNQSHDFSDAVPDTNGGLINCGWLSNRTCPSGSYCNIAPNDAYAYCARPKNQLPSDAIIDAGGNTIECGPQGYCGTHVATCKPHPSYSNGYCAKL